ncbi:uncharacterized protein LOC117380965 [Periophthalmus magnuspinnatus]|uniref:uncharacterized protein LOC117380965 n=1 Tax=Periophthalmus magnuspinnatus TaxID=409849 RepID=UPI002436CA97|nr:uncharacterized protein LOC117380965 [Periophthalmus magnuspinnatus]
MDIRDIAEIGSGPFEFEERNSNDINEIIHDLVEVQESDSEDSLFLTQKPQTSIPNAATSPHLSIRSTPISPRFLESESSSSSSEGEGEGGPKRRKRHPSLPIYNFPFLNQRKSQSSDDRYVHAGRNRAIHYGGMAGFFKCVDVMWPNGKRRKCYESLPTVDADNEEITPITEDDESDEEDVKIIDKRLFVYSLKPKITKSSQPWVSSLRNKIAKTTKPTRTSISQQHFGGKKTSQSTSSKPQDLSKKIQENVDSSSDETSIEESIIPRGPSIYSHNDTVHLAQVNQVTDQGIVLSDLDELEDSESQSILQKHSLDIRGRDHSICDANEVLSTKMKQGDVILEDKNENLSTSLSQESADLFEDYITNYSSPHRHKDKTPRKMEIKNLITENNGNTVEKFNDVESTSLTKLTSASCNQEKEVKGQRLPEDAELLSCTNDEDNGVRTVQKKKKSVVRENAKKEQNGTNLDPLQLVNNLEKEVKEQSLPEYAELLSCQNVDVEDNGDGTVQKKKKTKKKKGDMETAEKEQNLTNLDPSQKVNNGQLDGISALDKTVSNMSEDGRKLKKKQKSTHDCYALKEFPLQNADKNSSPSSVGNHKISNLVNNDNTVTEGDEPVSVRKKKKSPSAENEQNGAYLDPLRIVNNGQSDNMVEVDKTVSNLSDNKRKLKKKKTKEARDCDEEFALKEFQHKTAESQEISNLISNDHTGTDSLSIQGYEPVSVRKKKKRPVLSAENEQNGTYLDPLRIVNNGQSENMAEVDKTVSNLSDNKRKHKKKPKEAHNCDDEEFALKEFQHLKTDKNTLSGLAESQKMSDFISNDHISTHCLSVQGDGPVSVRKKKKRSVLSAEKEENGTYLDPLQIANLHNGQSDNMADVDETVSNLTDNKRKHKKKRKAVCNEDLASNEPPLHNTDKNSSSGLVGNHEKPELLHNNNDTDCIATQGHDSESVIKKKKKVHSMAGTVQNVTLDLSLSEEGHGADGLDISTNVSESAENITFLQENELGNKVKKKKKKRKKDRDGELNNLDANAKVTEVPEMNEHNKSIDCDSTEVNQPPSDEGVHVRKKKKKTSQSEICHTGMGKTTPEGVKGSVILSPKASECPERKKGDKKKRQHVESVVMKTSEVMELEQRTVKRKKHKGCFKDHEQTVPSPSHVEISPSSGKPEKSDRTKARYVSARSASRQSQSCELRVESLPLLCFVSLICAQCP